MKVRLCANCVYTPEDLAGAYDSHAEMYACMGCPMNLQTVLEVKTGTYHKQSSPVKKAGGRWPWRKIRGAEYELK